MKVNLWRSLVLGIILPIIVVANANDKKASSRMTEENNDINKSFYTLPQDCDFMEVRNNVGQEFACSPRLVEEFFSEFRGLIINGPKEMVWPKTISQEDYFYTRHGNTDSPHRLLIAGLARVLYSTLGLEGRIGYDIKVIAVNQHTAEAYSGTMRRFVVPGPGFGYADEDPTRIAETHFNLDLVYNLGIPIQEAVYTVYAVLGDYKSNVLTIKTRVK